MSANVRLPGFDAVLREHKRLATKLTSDELKAIQDYIEDLVQQEQADVNFRLYALRNDYDVTVRRSSETISDLYQELNEKKEIIKHYQDSDHNVSVVIKQKEQRWDKKQDVLLKEIEELDNEATNAKERLQAVEQKLEVKAEELNALNDKLEEVTKDTINKHEANKLKRERDEAHTGLLKVKMEVDKRDRQIDMLNKTVEALTKAKEEHEKEQAFADMKVKSMQNELQKQIGEVAKKCEDLSRLQFQLQLEKRQTQDLQRQLQLSTQDTQHLQKLIETSRPGLNPRDPAVAILKKDLDIMDMRIRSLEANVKQKLEHSRTLEQRMEELKGEHALVTQVKSEIYTHGDSYLELTVSELTKNVEFRIKTLSKELNFAHDWETIKRDADVLRNEISALMRQAAICKVTELSDRAAKQLHKVDLIMRVTADKNAVTRIYKVSDRRNSDRESQFSKKSTFQPTPRKNYKHAFVPSSTPISAFYKNHHLAKRPQRHVTGFVHHRYPPRTATGNQTLETTFHYIDGGELDMSKMTSGSTARGNQSDRLTLKSMSTSSIPAMSE